MKKFVSESLQEFINESKVKSARKMPKGGRKIVMDETQEEKAKQAIKALKADLAKEKKSKGDKHKIADIEKKIEAWEKKLKKD